MIQIIIKLKRLFCLSSVSSSKTVSDIERRIIKSKKIVKYNFYRNTIFVENYQEVREILQYEDTLGIALFVRDFIARGVDNKRCVKYLLRSQRGIDIQIKLKYQPYNKTADYN